MLNQRQIYSAESTALRKREVIRNMLSGMLRSRYMAYRLCLKDIKAEYSQSAFGMFWDFLDPLVLGAVFYFLKRGNVFSPGELTMPYAVFVIYGLLLYQTFSESILLCLSAMRRSKNILTHLRMPPEAIILSILYRVAFNSIFRIIAMLAFSLILYSSAAETGVSAFSPIGFLKFLALYPLIILAGMAIGIFLAPFNAIYSDVDRFVRIILTPLRFATPVLYVLPTTFPFDRFNAINPITVILTNLRELATNDVFLNPVALGLHTALYAVLFLVGWFIFHVSIPILAERS